MTSDEARLVPEMFAEPETQACYTQSIRYDRQIQTKLVVQLEFLSDIFVKAQLELQTRLLSVVVYKHKNQLCKHKSLQYARRIVKMIDRVGSTEVKILLNDLSLHVNSTCTCIWSKESELSCTDIQMEIINKIICKVQIIVEALRSCGHALPWVICNLKSNKFITFHIFLLSSFSRARVVLLRIYKEFIKAFELMEELNIVSTNVLYKLSSMRHEFLSESEVFLEDTEDPVFADENVQNKLQSSKIILDMLQVNSKDEKLLSDVNLLMPQVTGNQFVNKDDNGYRRKEVKQSIGMNYEIESKSGVCDIGISLARKDRKELEHTVHALSSGGSCKYLVKNMKYNHASPASKLIRQKKTKQRLTRALCFCWKCQQNRRHFHNQRWRKYAFRHMTMKYCIIRGNTKLGKRKRRKALLEKNLKEVVNASHKQSIEQDDECKHVTSRSFFHKRLSATKPDDIDLIFDAL